MRQNTSIPEDQVPWSVTFLSFYHGFRPMSSSYDLVHNHKNERIWNISYITDDKAIVCNFETDDNIDCRVKQSDDDDDQWYRVLASEIILDHGTAKDHTTAQG